MTVHTHTYMKRLMTCLASATLLVACGPGEDGEEEMTTVQGRLESQESDGKADDAGGASAESVAAYRVSASGELEQLATANVTAEGEFTIDIPMDSLSEAREEIVIEAYSESEAKVSAVAVARAFEANKVYTSAPMNQETHAEATIYIEAKSSGTWCTDCTLPELRAMVDAQAAAKLESSSQSDRYTKAAASLSAGIQAQANVFAELSDRYEASAREASKEEVASAQLTLDAKLYAAKSASAAETAHEANAKAYVAAYADAGYGDDVLARAFTARARAVERTESDLDADARASLSARVELEHALFVNAAVEASAEGESSAEYKEAYSDLEAAIAAQAEAGASAEADVQAAWAAWEEAAKSELDAQFEAGTALAIDGLTTSLDAAAAAYVTATASVSGGGDVAAEAIVQAQSALYASFTAEANVTVLTATGVEEGTAKSYLEARAHLVASAQ